MVLALVGFALGIVWSSSNLTELEQIPCSCDTLLARMPKPAHQTRPNPEKNPRRDPTAAGQRDASVNRIASHNYFLLEKFEFGVALTGTEVKSIRAGQTNLKDSY